MKILVAISKVPDTTTKITLKDDRVNEDGVQWVINPYDEWYALVKAIEIKEKDSTVQVTVLHVGNSSSDAILRKALAYGADDAIRIDADAKDSFFVAAQIAEIAKDYDLTLTGKESIDYNQGAVGGLTAALLNLPYAAMATALEVNGATNIVVTKETEGGCQKEEIVLPAVISCTKGMAVQRIPNMRGIMAARTKPLKTVAPVPAEAFTEIVAYELPAEKAGVQMLHNVDEFVAVLKDKKLI